MVDKDMVIIAGHTRYKAAKKLGMKKVPVVVADNLSPEQVKAYRLADNKTGELADLVSASNEHQKELTELVNSILDIAKAPDKREANTRYRSVMKRIGDFATVTTSGLNIAKLVQLATAMFQMMM